MTKLELEKENRELRKKIADLEEQCDVLWDLLDEIKKSDIKNFNRQLQEEMVKAQETAYYRALLNKKLFKSKDKN
tara:strand:+ start:138 stop:362 length:225 start_codon:yes stop_codon:yes gene_type:complete